MPTNGLKTGKDSNRDNSGRFIKGNRGGGRTAIPVDVQEMLKAATKDAVQLLIDTMNDEAVRRELRIDCCKTIIERVYGKAAQPIEGGIQQEIRVILGEFEEYSK